MSGKFVVKAGQQQFKSGEKVVSPVTVLPPFLMITVIKLTISLNIQMNKETR